MTQQRPPSPSGSTAETPRPTSEASERTPSIGGTAITAAPLSDSEKIRRQHARSLMEAQFVFYRRLVARKHNFEVWLELSPADLSDTELEAAVAFVKDAAHLPPG